MPLLWGTYKFSVALRETQCSILQQKACAPAVNAGRFEILFNYCDSGDNLQQWLA